METYVSRKRPRLSSDQAQTEASTPLPPIVLEHDEESTDFKLALLASSHPDLEQQVLLDILMHHDGSVEMAAASLDTRARVQSPPKKVIGYQSSLSGFLGNGSALKRPKLLSKKGKTLHLYSPEDVAAHTPCSITHNFLPAEEANNLLTELLQEAPSYSRMTFKLFDNVVQSPHTACFYVGTAEEQETQKTEYYYNGDRLSVSSFG